MDSRNPKPEALDEWLQIDKEDQRMSSPEIIQSTPNNTHLDNFTSTSDEDQLNTLTHATTSPEDEDEDEDEDSPHGITPKRLTKDDIEDYLYYLKTRVQDLKFAQTAMEEAFSATTASTANLYADMVDLKAAQTSLEGKLRVLQSDFDILDKPSSRLKVRIEKLEEESAAVKAELEEIRAAGGVVPAEVRKAEEAVKENRLLMVSLVVLLLMVPVISAVERWYS